MTPDKLPRPLRGIIPPMVTPLTGPDLLDYPGLERLVEHILAGGVHGLFILGTSGDGPALSYALRQELIRLTCKQVAGRVPVLVGITDTSFVESLRMAEAAAAAGASAVVMAPPYYFHLSQADLLRVVTGVAGRSALPLYLYNMPALTKLHWQPETVVIASDIENVYGLKDSSGDFDYLTRLVAAVEHKPEFAILLGPEHLLLRGLEAGVHGGVCGGANLVPRLFVSLFEQYRAGKMTEAQQTQRHIDEIASPLYSVGASESSYLRGLKGALHVAGICSGRLAWPFDEADDSELDAIRTHLHRYEETKRHLSFR